MDNSFGRPRYEDLSSEGRGPTSLRGQRDNGLRQQASDLVEVTSQICRGAPKPAGVLRRALYLRLGCRFGRELVVDGIVGQRVYLFVTCLHLARRMPRRAKLCSIPRFPGRVVSWRCICPRLAQARSSSRAQTLCYSSGYSCGSVSALAARQSLLARFTLTIDSTEVTFMEHFYFIFSLLSCSTGCSASRQACQ